MPQKGRWTMVPIRLAILLVALAVVAGCSGGPPRMRMKVNRIEGTLVCGSANQDNLEGLGDCFALPVEGIDTKALHTGNCVIVQMKWNANEEERRRGIGFENEHGEIVDCATMKFGK